MLNCRRDVAVSMRRLLCLLGLLSLTTQSFGFNGPAIQQPGCGSGVAAEQPPWGYIAVADAGSAESDFARALKALGLIPFFVRSDQNASVIPSGPVFTSFESDITSRLESGSFPDVLAGLRMIQRRYELPLTHVVAEGGTRSSYFGERLSAALALPGHDANFVDSITVPRDIFIRLSKHFDRAKSNIKMMPQTIAENAAEVKAWLHDELRGWHRVDGLVVETGTRYSGSPRIFVKSDLELDRAVNHIKSGKTPMGWTPNRVLVTPYIAGEEYSVNGAVLHEGGRTYVRFTSVVHHVRPDRTDSGNEISLFDFEVPPGLLDAQVEVLRGLQYGMGPFHGQFKIGNDGTIYFVKNVFRFHGHGLTGLLDSCSSYGQVQAAADVYGNVERFKAESKKSFDQNARSVVVSIEVPRTDKVLRANHGPLDQIERLLSKNGHLYKVERFVKHQQVLEPSNGSLTVMARVEIRIGNQLDREARIREYLSMIQQMEAQQAFFR